MTPIRVLQVVTHMERGGLESMLMNYYRHVDRERVQFDFWCTVRSGQHLTMRSNPLVGESIVCRAWCRGAKVIYLR